MRNGTALFNNFATTGLGANLHLPSATIYYEFPVPAGHWLPNGECRVYREPCNEDDQDCKDNVAACGLIDVPTPSGVSNPLRTTAEV